jgi:hypothetical protein
MSRRAPLASTGRSESGNNRTAPRLALRKEEAAAALGISDESFDRYVRPHLAVCRWGSLRVYPVAEIERLLSATAEAPLEGGGR